MPGGERAVLLRILGEDRLLPDPADVRSALKATEVRGELPVTDGLGHEQLAFGACAPHGLFN